LYLNRFFGAVFVFKKENRSVLILMKDPTQENTTNSILEVVAKFDKLSNSMDQLYKKGQTFIRDDGKIPLHAQKKILLELNGIQGSTLNLKKSLNNVAVLGRRSGEEIIQLLTIASFTSKFLVEKDLLCEFKAFVEQETGKPIKPTGLLEKIKFWRKK
jgi:hypothetical protein